MALLRGSRACSRRSFTLIGGLLCGLGALAAQSAQTGSQHGTGRHHGRAEGEHHQHDGDEYDDGENQTAFLNLISQFLFKS